MPFAKCFGCGNETSETSLKICGQFLCADCEGKLVSSDAVNTDYQQWIDGCRRFWEELEAQSGAGQG